MPEPAAALLAFAPADTLLVDLLALSPTGILYYSPQTDAAGAIIDFQPEYLNPAAQRLLRLPERPALTHNEQWPPHSVEGVFAFLVDAYGSGASREFDVTCHDHGYHLAACRSGAGLLVNVTAAADRPRIPAEQALRDSQAREQAALAEADAQRRRFYDVLMQLPASVATFRGPDLVYDLVTPSYQQLFRTRRLLGLPIRDALPELRGQGIFDKLERVYRTGEAHHEREQETWVDVTDTGQPERRYYTVSFQPLRDAHGRVDGVFNFAVDVTAYVEARQQAEQLHQELEARVQERTRQLWEQSHRLERLIQQAPAAIAVLDGPDWVVELLNPAYEALFPGRNLRGKSILEGLPELVDGPGAALLRQVYDTGETFEGREVLMHFARPGDGHPEARYFDFIYQARYDAASRINGLVLFGFEVTDKVQSRQQAAALHADLLAATQRQLQERETLYQVFAQTPAAICIQRGPEHRYTYANQAYHDFFPGRQLLGLSVAEALPETVGSGVVALLDRVYQTGETYYGEELPLLIAQPDGSSRWMYFTFTYQAYREQGEIVGISTFAYNVAEQVLARQQREAQRQQLQAVFAQAPVAICVFQGEAAVLDVINPSMAEMLGHPLAALVGQPFFEVLPELRTQGLPDLLAGVRRTGTPYVAQEQKIQLARHQPGAPGYFNFVYQPLLDADGRVAGIVCVATDVTEHVRARQQVQELNEELAAINEELTVTNEELHEANTRLVRTNVDLDNFIYTASHDLKVPITNIEGLLHALQAQLPADAQALPEVGPVLAMMQQSVERFQRTLTYLSDVTQLQQEAGQAVTEVALHPVLDDVCQDLQPLLAQADARLDVDLQACPAVRFSPKNLRSVVYNLLSNALKYRHPDRPAVVFIRGHQEAGYAVLTVRDNGIGIPPRRHADLFQLFRRLHSHVEGSGVGLYMVKRMVDNAGGRMEVASEPEVGTTFRVYFPR